MKAGFFLHPDTVLNYRTNHGEQRQGTDEQQKFHG
jgi:hypothetical protein